MVTGLVTSKPLKVGADDGRKTTLLTEGARKMQDREKLIELLDEASFMLKELCGGYNDGTGNEVRADHLIANGVTVRERGRWEWYTDRCEDLFLGCDEDYGWRCNRCKTPLEDCDDPEVHPTCNFCPNCGADMRQMEEANV
jgi:hypothetical protein